MVIPSGQVSGCSKSTMKLCTVKYMITLLFLTLSNDVTTRITLTIFGTDPPNFVCRLHQGEMLYGCSVQYLQLVKGSRTG